ncbi:hypothetical protein [Psychroserpens sp. MEBiC05023]
MNTYEYLYTASYVIYNLASLIMVVTGIVLFNKIRTLATTLILVGSIFNLVLGVGSILISSFASRYDTDTFLQVNIYSNIAQGLSYFMFGLGLLLFVLNDFKNEERRNEFLGE